MKIDISGVGTYCLESIFIDFNGTIAKDGQLIEKVLEPLMVLSKTFNLHVITGDTYGNVRKIFQDLPINVIIANSATEKLEVIKSYKPENSIAIGNGSIDYLMLDAAKLGICVVGDEGASVKAIHHADIIVNNIFDAFDIISSPNKIIATLKE